MSERNTRIRRAGTTLAACALLALGACSKEIGNNAEPKPGVGAKIDHAIERTQQKLENAGERTREGVEAAAEKTQEALSKAGDRISNATSAAVNEAKQQSLPPGSPPYAPRQPVNDATATATTDPSGTTSTTTTLSSGPTTSVKISGIPADSVAR